VKVSNRIIEEIATLTLRSGQASPLVALGAPRNDIDEGRGVIARPVRHCEPP
jgi:hypothetical protein